MKLRSYFFILYFLSALSLVSQESGKLQNGLEYYVLHNEVPKGRASIWFVLKVGIMHESQDQKGFAHLVEHLAWSGTKNIDGEQYGEILERLGISEEPEHISSVSGIDSTVIRLNIALDDPEAIDKALFLLKEISSSATLLPLAIDTEKKTVSKETANAMIDPMTGKLEKQLEVLTGYPIQLFSQKTIDNIQNARAEQLQDFYRLKYRPDQMAIIAVGNFDEKKMKEKIEEHFGLLSNHAELEVDKVEHINLPGQTSLLVYESAHFDLPKVSVAYLLPRDLEKDIEQMLIPLVENRLQNLVDEEIVLSTCCCHTVVSPIHQFVEIGAVLFDESSILSIAHRICAEVDQIEQLGFTEDDWSYLHEQGEELPSITNEVYARAYTDRFLNRLSPMPLELLLNKNSVADSENILKGCPKVITLAVKSRESLYR